ncbi:redoxin [Pyrenophora tritici-repentis]|nr:redoxin [Pyrenophora tritici-repentis]
MLLGALPPALVSLLLVATGASAAPYNFLNNYRDPVPSPEDGPPAAYHAIRNKDVLPYEICGVVGGYVLTVLVWGVLLLTVGRRMRRKALDPPMQLELELQGKPIRPSLKTPSLASPPLSARSFFRRFKRNGSSDSTPQSPEVSSPTSFDQKVVDAHRDQNQADMERLYAAVMDFDAQKHASKVSVEQPEPAPIQTERRRPSAINVNHAQNDNNDSPVSPVKAIYPPSYSDRPTTAPLPHDRLRAEQQAPPSPRGILTKRSQVLNPNAPSKNARFNLKNLRISGPIAKYPGDSDDEARTPLSPRFYTPGAPPSPPTQTSSPISPYRDEAINTIHPLPLAAPQRTAKPKAPTSTPANHSLPLRSFAEPLASPGIQTTVLDHRVDKLSMQTPKTGVPFTPYSPYMPFTPVTPVTPHLTTRRDRKMEAKLAKLEGRRRQAANELVQTPKEIFGDAW